MNGLEIEADQLNEAWDVVVTGDEILNGVDSSTAGLYLLLGADADTPSPDPAFLAALRSSLVGSSIDRRPSKSPGSLGIVAFPVAPGGTGNQWSKRAILFAVAAILAIAILSTGFTLRAGGRPEIGLPTAQASAQAPISTPVAQATETLPRVDS